MPTMRLTALFSEPATPGEAKTKGDHSKNFTLRELLLQKSTGKDDDDDDDDCVKLPQLNVVRIAVSKVIFLVNFFLLVKVHLRLRSVTSAITPPIINQKPNPCPTTGLKLCSR